MAPWITTAGLAGAAAERWGDARVISFDGCYTPKEALANATSDASSMATGTAAARPSPWVATAAIRGIAADLRSTARGWRFSRTLSWKSRPVPFVWQRHGLGVSARNLADRIGAPLVVSVHALMGNERLAWESISRPWARTLERTVERPAIRSADLVSCVSDELASLVAELGVSPDRIVVTPNGVDLAAFSPNVDSARVRQELGLEGRVVVGWTGSFRPFHGVDGLLRAFAAVEHSCPEASLLIVGAGQGQSSLQDLATKLGLESVVWAGAKTHEEMPEYLKAMDIGVIAGGTGQFHYSPVKLREYLASGMAVVAPDAGEIGRSFKDGFELVLVKAGDEHALASAIRGLVTDVKHRTALGLSARIWAERNASWSNALDNIVNQLNQTGPRLNGT